MGKQKLKILAVPGFAFAEFVVQGSLAFVPVIFHQLQGFIAAFIGLGTVIAAVGHRGELSLRQDHAPDTAAKASGLHPVQNGPHHQGQTIGAAGVSAVPMAARVVNKVGLESDPRNFLLMHAMGPNVAGVIGSAVAAGVLLKALGGL